MAKIWSRTATFKYKTVGFNDDSNLSTADDSAWSSGAAPFGDGSSTWSGSPPEGTNGLWPNGSRLWLHKEIDPKWRDLTLLIDCEDHATLYVNGSVAGLQELSGRGTAKNGRSTWAIPNKLLRTAGPNLIAIRGDDESAQKTGDTWVVSELYGRDSTAAVFEGTGFPFFTGSGTLTAQETVVYIANAYFSGGDATTEDFDRTDLVPDTYKVPPPPQLLIQVLDDTLIQAPTAVTVIVSGGQPGVEVVFDIDGVVVGSATLNSDGDLLPTSLPVPESVGAQGTHTITGTQTDSISGWDTFTLARNPTYAPRIVGPDAQAVEVPGAVTADGVRRWVLQDLMPGGLGSYVLPINPKTMGAPHFEKRLNAKHTTATSGQFHVSEAEAVPVEWTFEGYCPTQEMHDKLLAYGDLDRRFYVIDHRGRAWKSTFVQVDLQARLDQMTSWSNYQWTEWGHDFTITALVYDQKWVVPATTTAASETTIGAAGVLAVTDAQIGQSGVASFSDGGTLAGVGQGDPTYSGSGVLSAQSGTVAGAAASLAGSGALTTSDGSMSFEDIAILEGFSQLGLVVAVTGTVTANVPTAGDSNLLASGVQL